MAPLEHGGGARPRLVRPDPLECHGLVVFSEELGALNVGREEPVDQRGGQDSDQSDGDEQDPPRFDRWVGDLSETKRQETTGDLAKADGAVPDGNADGLLGATVVVGRDDRDWSQVVKPRSAVCQPRDCWAPSGRPRTFQVGRELVTHTGADSRLRIDPGRNGRRRERRGWNVSLAWSSRML